MLFINVDPKKYSLHLNEEKNNDYHVLDLKYG